MTEHEQLKVIFDKIEYRYRIKTTQAIKSPFYYNTEAKEFGYDFAITNKPKETERITGRHIDVNDYEFIVIDVREIIFTPDFMSRYIEKVKEKIGFDILIFSDVLLLTELYKPVEYLYKLIK